jgi:hypothetical protein
VLQIVTLVEFARYRFFSGDLGGAWLSAGVSSLILSAGGCWCSPFWALVCVAVTTCLNYPEWSQVVS